MDMKMRIDKNEEYLESCIYRCLGKYKGVHIYISNKYSYKKYKKIEKRIKEVVDILPENILNYLKLKNFKIRIVDKIYIQNYIIKDLYRTNNLNELKKIDKISENKNRIGLYLFGRMEIFVVYQDSIVEKFRFYDEFKKLLLHEIAHFLDYKKQYNLTTKYFLFIEDKDNGEELDYEERFRRSDNSKFKDIMSKEKWIYAIFWDKHYKEKYSEYFAEAFAKYLLMNSKLNKILSKIFKTHKYIEKFIHEFK